MARPKVSESYGAAHGEVGVLIVDCIIEEDGSTLVVYDAVDA